jgi:hypothetical protein
LDSRLRGNDGILEVLTENPSIHLPIRAFFTLNGKLDAWFGKLKFSPSKNSAASPRRYICCTAQQKILLAYVTC